MAAVIAAGPLIRMIAIAAGGGPLEQAKIVSSVTRYFAARSNIVRHRPMLASLTGAQLRIMFSMTSDGTTPSIESVIIARYFWWIGVRSGSPIKARASWGVQSISTLIFIGVSPLEPVQARLHSPDMYARDTARIATPLGMITLSGDDDALHSLTIGDGTAVAATAVAVRAAEEQLRAWFAGTLTLFDLPLSPAVSARGQALRDAMVAIDYGETLSYGALARQAGSSARAIGQACARNPFPIVVPCHRVLNASGSLGAYSAGEGPNTKAWLLDFERGGQGDLLL